MQETANNRNRIIITSVAVVIAIAIIGLSVMAANGNQSLAASQTSTSSADTSSSPSTTMMSNNSSSSMMNNSSYKDGTYTATGTYSSPGSYNEHITITVTLRNGTVASTSAQPGAQERDGMEYQSFFIQDYPQLVVGKSIDNVYLNRVSGSSLTSQGFNDAIDQIKQQAKA